jgi:hypothetical protein
MTREELRAVIEVVLGIHSSPDKVDTVLRAADAYAATIARRQRELLEAGS